MARRLCRDESEAHDIAQEAYLAVYRYWRDGKLREPPRLLLFRVAQRGAADVLRARARRERIFAALPKAETVAWPDRDLRDALAMLKPEDAALVLLQGARGSELRVARSDERPVGRHHPLTALSRPSGAAPGAVR